MVEIDECKIGRCIVEGNWILGMIDRNRKEVCMAVCPRHQRDVGTLYLLISDHMEITSTIHTGCWRGYNGLMARWICGSLNSQSFPPFFKSCDRCSHKYHESQWRSLHRRLNRGGRKNDINVHIAEYMWTRNCESHLLKQGKSLV